MVAIAASNSLGSDTPIDRTGYHVPAENKHSWVVTVHQGGEKILKVVKSKQDAKDLVQYIHKQELAGINVIETIRQARAQGPAPAPTLYPALKDAVPDWIDRQARARQF